MLAPLFPLGEPPRDRKCPRASRRASPLFTTGRLRALYGIVRPCPELVCLSPQLEFQHVVVRDEQEARQLAEVMSPRARITHLGLSRDTGGCEF